MKTTDDVVERKWWIKPSKSFKAGIRLNYQLCKTQYILLYNPQVSLSHLLVCDYHWDFPSIHPESPSAQSHTSPSPHSFLLCLWMFLLNYLSNIKLYMWYCGFYEVQKHTDLKFSLYESSQVFLLLFCLFCMSICFLSTWLMHSALN